MQSHSGILTSTPLKAKFFKNSKNFQPYERAAVGLSGVVQGDKHSLFKSACSYKYYTGPKRYIGEFGIGRSSGSSRDGGKRRSSWRRKGLRSLVR